MIYSNMKRAVFLKRPNRFIAEILVDGQEQICHVKNTGRCAELLVPGAEIYVQQHFDSNRKTPFSLIAVQKGERLINMDSQAPNRVVEEWVRNGGIFGGVSLLKPEQKYGNSRFDLYAESGSRKAYLEVKGVTLEENGIVRFPDAPTQRGVKHLNELCGCLQQGFEAYVVFVIQMEGVRWFEPNDHTDPQFGETLRYAAEQGVHIVAMDCQVSPDQLVIHQPVEIHLKNN